MSGRSVAHFAPWLVSYDQALTAEDHMSCLASPDFETRQSAQKMVKQIPGGFDCFPVNDMESEASMGDLRNTQ